MPAQTIYLLRHGHSLYQEGIEATGTDPGIIDAGLSTRGAEQVRRLSLAVDVPDLDLVITSPLTRAIDTALGLVASHPGTPLVVQPLTRERLEDSCDIGRSASELQARYPNLDLDHLAERWWHDGPQDDRGIAVEPEEVINDRVAEFRDWLDSRSERSIAVVSHSGFLVRLTGMWLANCELVEWRR